MNKAQKAFKSLVSKGFESSDYKTVESVVLAFWHENFMPNLDGLDSEKELQRAGFLMDMLARFNCMEKERRMSLFETACKLKDSLNPVVTQGNNDQVAKEWGLNEDLRGVMPDLLQYQTRHYRHTP